LSSISVLRKGTFIFDHYICKNTLKIHQSGFDYNFTKFIALFFVNQWGSSYDLTDSLTNENNLQFLLCILYYKNEYFAKYEVFWLLD